MTSITAYVNIIIPSHAGVLAKTESNRERSDLIEKQSENRRCFTIIWSLDSGQRNCFSFADDFNALLLNSFFCRGSQINSVGFSGVLSELAVLYFSDSEVRHWQANDTSLGGDPQSPKKGGDRHLKRTRSHQVSFRLSDKEYALLQERLTASQLSLTKFFIETISKGKVIVINDFVPLLSEMKRQGVNLNQLVRRVNQFSPVSEQEILVTLQQCQNTYRRLYELSEQLGA